MRVCATLCTGLPVLTRLQISPQVGCSSKVAFSKNHQVEQWTLCVSTNEAWSSGTADKSNVEVRIDSFDRSPSSSIIVAALSEKF